jgi:DNA-binding NarL/FixJ family response regulator
VLAREVLAAGASGYMLKRGMRKELVEAVNNIANGFKHISIDVALELGHYFDSELMGLSEETIKTHLKTILAKTKARDRTHAVTIALQRGMLRV